MQKAALTVAPGGMRLSRLHHSRSCLRTRLMWTRASVAPAGISDKEVVELDFVSEMRQVSMSLHKRPPKKEGQEDAQKPFEEWVYTVEGYLRFLVESRRVYTAFEEIIQFNNHYSLFRENGLDRVESLNHDIAWISREYGLEVPTLSTDGPSETYAKKLEELGRSSPPGFICNFYNFYLAHTAGGRMIGAKVANEALHSDFDRLAFYKYDGDVKTLVAEMKESLNEFTADWTREEKDASLEEVPVAFKSAGNILRTMFSVTE